MSRASFTWRGDDWARSVLPQAVATGINAAAVAVQGEFGLSLRQGAKVSRLIAERLPATLELALVAATLALALGAAALAAFLAGVFTSCLLAV